MFTYFALLISYILYSILFYCILVYALLISYILYSILFYCILVYAAPTLLIQILMFLIPILWICVWCVYCYLLDITALLELETQAFRYTRNNIC
jgi:hypothetical protein